MHNYKIYAFSDPLAEAERKRRFRLPAGAKCVRNEQIRVGLCAFMPRLKSGFKAFDLNARRTYNISAR